MATREDYVKQLSARLERWKEEIRSLEARIRGAKDAGEKARHERDLEEVRDKERQARRRLDEVKAASEEAWQDLRQGAERVWKSVDDALHKARSRFKQGQ